MPGKRKATWTLLTAAILWLVLIVFLSSQTGAKSGADSLKIAAWLQTHLFSSLNLEVIHHGLRKFAHVFVFLVEEFLLLLAFAGLFHRKWVVVLSSAGICGFVAMIDEVHKLWIPGRHCQWVEVLLNILGVGIGLILAGVVLWLNEKVQKRKEKL